MEEDKDQRLWKLATKRAQFKRHFLSYIVVNGFLWGLWIITRYVDKNESIYPWPIWPMLGWGIGLFFNYRDAYSDSNSLAEREYQKLKKKNEE